MLLIDDEADSVIGTASNNAAGYEKLYDFDLMCGGGNIKGFKISGEDSNKIISALEKLADKKGFEKKYNVSGKDVLLFAVGDGNHSLATAKECYTRLKAKLPNEEYLNSPARYALVELVNLHDESLEFEAIHRVVFGVNPKHLLDEMFKYYDCTFGKADGQAIEYVTKNENGDITVKNAKANLPVGTLQEFLDKYIAENGGTIDYIHGADVTEKLAKEADDRIGFILPAMAKNELFKTVILDGALPRKTFSMGEAFEKRFYLEARKIK